MGDLGFYNSSLMTKGNGEGIMTGDCSYCNVRFLKNVYKRRSVVTGKCWISVNHRTEALWLSQFPSYSFSSGVVKKLKFFIFRDFIQEMKNHLPEECWYLIWNLLYSLIISIFFFFFPAETWQIKSLSVVTARWNSHCS